jgi:hypothetical protein
VDNVVHRDVKQIAAKYRFRARLSLGLIAALGATGSGLIWSTASRVDGALALFIGGVAMCVCAHTMIIGWGASDGHGDLARLAADGHERMHDLIAQRLENIEAIERQTGDAIVIALDEVRDRRRKREG